MRRVLALFLPLLLSAVSGHPASAQPLADRLLGTWTGVMHMYKEGKAQDSVAVRFTVSRGTEPNTWSWKTEYLSEKMPMTKDYTMRQSADSPAMYLIDEGGGILLQDYQFGNKLYSVFETHDVLLTSTYELRGKDLIFEVTSGRKIPGGGEVTNYSVQFLQRVVLRRIP